MTISIKTYEDTFLTKIKAARSQAEVRTLINDSLKNLDVNNWNKVQLADFIDISISNLENFDPMKKNASEWSNINMARIHFQHIKRNLN